MAEWWSIEVFSGDKLPASGWRYAYEDELTEAAITHGAMYYEWHDAEYGVIFEVLFPDDALFEAFRDLPAVRAALDAVPDPVNGLLIYRGRGGTSGGTKPRKPKPAPGAAALELEVPREERRLRLPRKLRYRGGGANFNDDDWDELRREIGIGAPGEDGPGTDAPGTGAPPAGAPGTEPAWRDIAAVDRSNP